MNKFLVFFALLALVAPSLAVYVPVFRGASINHGIYGGHSNVAYLRNYPLNPLAGLGHGAYGLGRGAYGLGQGAYGLGQGAYGLGQGAYSRGYGAYGRGYGAYGLGGHGLGLVY